MDRVREGVGRSMGNAHHACRLLFFILDFIWPQRFQTVHAPFFASSDMRGGGRGEHHTMAPSFESHAHTHWR